MGYDTNCSLYSGYVLPLQLFDFPPNSHCDNVQCKLKKHIKDNNNNEQPVEVFVIKNREEYNNDESEYKVDQNSKVFIGLPFNEDSNDEKLQQTNENSENNGSGLAIKTFGHGAVFDKFAAISADDFYKQQMNHKAIINLLIKQCFPKIDLQQHDYAIVLQQNGR